MRTVIERIALLVAMRLEAAPLIASLGLTRDEPPADHLPFELYRAQRGAGEVALLLNGTDPATGVDSVCTQPAALAAWLAVERLRPDLLISAGLAGGFAARGTAIGDVYLAGGRFVYHDRRIPIARYDDYGVGGYRALDVGRMAGDLGYKLGTVSSGNSLDYTPRDLGELQASGADVKDMEAAAVAWVGTLCGVPVTAVKVITDLVDIEQSPERQFLANLKLAAERLEQAAGAVVDYCLGRTPAELAGG